LRNVSTATDNLAALCGTYTNVLVSSQVQIASGSGTVGVGARLGGYSDGIPSQGYTAEIESNGTVNPSAGILRMPLRASPVAGE
jgi:hypothetical protein